MAICQACGGSIAWVDDISSDVCEQCGTLANPSQLVLDSQIEAAPSTYQRDVLPWVKNGPIILKSRQAGKQSWTISGQDYKVIHSNREEMLMRETILTLTSKLNCPREFNRSFFLFTQAMSAGNFRWGSKAACVAGICISIALREAKRPDNLRQIAQELSQRYPDVTHRSLTRTYHSVISVLGLESSPANPVSYLALLRQHVEAALHRSTSPITESLSKLPPNLSLSATIDLAASLCSLLSTLPENHELKNLPAGPTACACFLHAMEGVLRSELPDLGNIAQSLGSKWGFSQKSVQNRYRCIQDVLLSEIDKTPGLDGDKRGKRKKVCRNMKEALQYRDLIADEAPSKRCLEDVDSVEAPPVPKKRALKRSVAAAREFVLNPFVNPIASTSGSYRRTPSHVPPLSQTLMAHPDNAPPLTRLQALSLERGGSTEEEVSDSELFAEGELDEMLRTPEQMKVMMGTYLYQEWEEAQQKAALREAEDAANDALSAGLPDGSGLTVFSDGEGNEPEMVIYPDLFSWNEMRFDDDFELGHDLEDDHPVLYQDQNY